MTLSNTISLCRIFCILPFVLCVAQVQQNGHYRYVCLCIMLVIGLSDVMDGYIARKRSEITNLGKYLDPAADKLVLSVSFIILSFGSIWPEPRVPQWVALLIVCRDFLLVSGTLAVVSVRGKMNFQPILLGRMTTIIQIIAIMSVLMGNHIPLAVLIAIWWLTGILTLTSGFLYMYRGVRQL